MKNSETTYEAKFAYDVQEAASYDYSRFHKDKKKRKRDAATQKAVIDALGRLSDCNKLLDMPCGTGRLHGRLVETGYDYTGCDLSQEMLDVFRQKHPREENVRIIRADGECLPFRSESFDCIVCVRFLPLVPSGARPAILKEFNRVSARYLLVSASRFGVVSPIIDRLAALFPWVFPKAIERREKCRKLSRELADTGWVEHFRMPYKSRGVFFSSSKAVAVFKKG